MANESLGDGILDRTLETKKWFQAGKLEVADWNPTLVFWILARKHPIVPKFFSICPSLTTNNGQWKSWRWDTWQNFGDKKMVSGWKTRSCGLESHFSIFEF